MAMNQRTNFGAEVSLTPGAYNIDKIVLTTHDGKKYNIENIVVRLTLTESLYSPNIIAQLSIKDTVDFFESTPLIGQEKIKIVVITNPNTTAKKSKKIDLDFIVTEYPLYGSSTAAHTNVYNISCVSDHAYYSRLFKISRSFTNTTDEEIKKIITEDLGFSDFEVNGEVDSRMKGIIRWQTPLEAAEWLRSKTYDVAFSPFFLYHSLDNKIRLSSLHNLITEKEYHTYYDVRDFSADTYTEGDYNERVSRILDVASDLKLGKIYQGANGAWASENNYLDYTYKTYTKYDYNYKNDFDQSLTLNQKTPLSTQFDVNGETLNSMPQSHIEYTSINNLSYGEEDANYNKLKQNTNGKTQAIEELLETVSHDIKLFGDFDLNPGTVINLKFPKAVDPSHMKKLLQNMANNPKGHGDLFDKHLSGRHLITSVNHLFEDGQYFSEVRVKKDSFGIDV
tara:strand:- start:16096 stop:17448 length:1353 start_codon:yes stop_codon:yes gene_type:complete